MATPGLAPRARTVIVTIDPTAQKKVDPDPFHISEGWQDQVKWVTADPAASLKIDFPESPFPAGHFEKQDSPDCCSGPPKRNTHRKAPYKYDITLNGEPLDPHGIIDP